MLVGGFRAGARKGLACAGPVFGQEGSDPTADRPRPGAQIGIVRRGCLGRGQVVLPLPGPALVRHGKALHEQRRRLERDQAEPASRALHLTGDLHGVGEPRGHRHQGRDVGADADGQPDGTRARRLGAGLFEALAMRVA